MLRWTMCSVAAIAAVQAPTPAVAQAGSYSFAIPPQPLESALRSFARTTRLQVLFDRAAVRDKRSPGVTGTHGAAEALRMILVGSDLEASESARGAFVIRRAASSGVEPASAGGDEAPADDIVVTANKREERIVDVPFAISAVMGEEIERRGPIDLKELQSTIPSLSVGANIAGRDRITLRGIDAGTGTGLPVVGVYVDEFGISGDQQIRDTAFPLIDLERIEVLRGPQGTLYGQGSVAGTIRYITRNPSLTRFDGFAEGNVYKQSLGDIGYRLSGAVGGPLVEDRLGLRVTASYDRIAGWIDYPVKSRNDANVARRLTIRPKLLWKPSDDLTLSLLYQYNKQDTETNAISGFDGVRRRGSGVLFPAFDESHLANGVLTYDAGPITLTSSTGYISRTFAVTSELGAFFGVQNEKEEIFSQELRLASNGTGPLRYTFGGWYRHGLNSVDRTLFLNGVATNTLRLVGDNPADAKSYAAFGEASYAFAERLELTLGGRYFHDERTRTITIPATPTVRANYSAFSPKASLLYRFGEDSSAYATVSKGFRSGGFNSAGPATYGPESLWNYEGGVKLNLFDRRLYLDLSGYYLEYGKRQVQSLIQATDAAGNPIPNILLNVTTNGGRASGPGVEAALRGRLGGGLTVSGTFAYNNVKYDSTTIESVAGERFKLVPALTASASLDHRFALSARVGGFWRVDWQHQSPYNSIFRSTAGTPPAVVLIENYRNTPQDYVNLRFGIETGGVVVTADVTNLLDEDAYIFPSTPVAVTREGTHARPRSYGLTVRWNFGQ